MYLMLQQPAPEDYVIATGITITVREFVRMAFREAGMELEFKGKDENEVGIISKVTNKAVVVKPGTEVVAVDPKYYRPTEVDLLIGQQKWTC